ncbi:MAG: hypothetical protein OQK23_08725, partial [Rhodospirillales bacterium]|nr:hypothetical protein [Rhodospirillales bacterium]
LPVISVRFAGRVRLSSLVVGRMQVTTRCVKSAQGKPRISHDHFFILDLPPHGTGKHYFKLETLG